MPQNFGGSSDHDGGLISMVLSLLGFIDWEPQIVRLRETIQKVRSEVFALTAGEAGRVVISDRVRRFQGGR